MRNVLGLFFLTVSSCIAQTQHRLPPMPTTERQALGFIHNPELFPEEKMDFPLAAGPFAPTWQSIDAQYPGQPDWWREGKFGIFIHWGPQAAGESGDWYARRLYEEGTEPYQNHLKRFGHPSEFGYKDVLHQWNPTNWNPAALVQAYKDAGFRYALVVGVHHDNYDLWNSQYHPWNSVRVGPKKDFLALWKKELQKQGLRFGVAFHHEYTWWWWQDAFGADKNGPKAGVPYDGSLTLADGKGKWWEGLDPRLLYGISIRYDSLVHNGKPFTIPTIAFGNQGVFGNHLTYARWYATQWALRIQDVIDQYDPDFIYTDGNSTQPFSGYKSGSGYRSDAGARIVADFYNKGSRGKKLDKLSIVKFIPTNRGAGRTFEGSYPAGIKTDQPWMADMAVGDWFYQPDFYYDAGMVIRALLEYVSRDGNLTLCVSLTPSGGMDAGSARMLKAIGAWMRINGEGIYGSHAWKEYGEGEWVKDPKNPDKPAKLRKLPGGKLGKRHAEFQFSTKDFRFTRGKDGSIYAYGMTVPKQEEVLTIQSLGTKAGLLKQPIRAVELLGSTQKLRWVQTEAGLQITYPKGLSLEHVVGFRIR
ncbi:alpha-L-fucosidase [Siphonobacter curvatus]|uniref:alpha-L-fucosidase n=1 Tax=Siphonobacter curvatus TaxID=2094562 RepID=A0A2S7IKW3_9BACT|nr:alpha-L-fucosidase [Siphonobacter curvatus]PQA58362.1 alpha-L-fucosidase [Siphonobacter curvatus]